jgi:N-acetylglucosamine repressor
MRRMNEALVLGIIHDLGPISRSEIAETSGLSLAGISSIIASLVEQGIVVEESRGESTGGRRPILLAINRAAGLVIGAKLARDHAVVVLTDLGGEMVERRSLPIAPGATLDAVVEALGGAVDELRAANLGKHFLGLGLGMAGIIDREQGVCRYSPFFRWENAPVRQALAERVAMPVIVENDVNALTLAERWFGAGAGSPNFLVVTLGVGVGMGLMFNGELFRGSRDGAGEFGHSTVIENGPLCNCGKRGCVEAYVSEPALRRAASAATGAELTLEQAIERGRAGDAVVLDVFREAGHVLGLALASILNVLNPSLLIVGGEGVQYLDLLLPALEAALLEHSFHDLFSDVQLVVEPWSDDAWARGAAGLMLDEFFHPSGPAEDEAPANRRGGRPLRPASFSFPTIQSSG